jgi:hypothetical protein
LLDEQIVHVKQLANAQGQTVLDVAPFLVGLDEPTVTQAGQVPASVARAEVCGYCGLSRGHFAIAQRFQERQSGWIGEAIEDAGADAYGHPASHLRHEENDASPGTLAPMIANPDQPRRLADLRSQAFDF